MKTNFRHFLSLLCCPSFVSKLYLVNLQYHFGFLLISSTCFLQFQDKNVCEKSIQQPCSMVSNNGNTTMVVIVKEI